MEKPEPALAADWPKVYLFAANFQVNLRYPEKGMWRRKADDWYTSRVSGSSILLAVNCRPVEHPNRICN